jgi:hypothetical protein
MALFLASQVAIPLTYYLYKEPADERFAWRMFSSVHMGRWNGPQVVARVYRDGEVFEQAVPVEKLLVESSWKNLRDGHPDYRDKFLRHYLEQSSADEVLYLAQGFWPSGEAMAPVRARIHRRDGVVRRSAN